MATQAYAYDHPQYQVHVPVALNLSAVAASTEAGKFVAFQACKVKSLRCVIGITGTNDAAGYDIYNGTTSVGSIVVGTAAVNSAATVTFTEQTLAAGGYIGFKTKANSATTANSVVLEVEPVPGATVTV